MLIIGITGGIGCGKSEVCLELKNRYGAFIVMADQVAHDMLKPGSPCYDDLCDLLGKEYTGPDGSFDRKRVGDLAFSNPEIITRMNEIIHPAVEDRVFELMDLAEQKGRGIFVLEAALLIEAGYKQFCNDVWYIYANKKVRIKRLKATRNLSDEKIEDIMSNQLSEEEFRELCDYTIDNSHDFNITAMQIRNRLASFGI